MSQPATYPLMTRHVLFMGITYSMGGVIYGYDTGQISGFLEMESFQEAFGIYDPATSQYILPAARSGLIVAIVSIGTLVGSLTAGPLADRIGRKMPTLLSCLIYAIGASVQIGAGDRWYQLVIGRCLGGIGIGALSILAPLAINETAPKHNRGYVVAGYCLGVTTGMFLASLINLGTQRLTSAASWMITVGLDYLWASLMGIGLLFVPESPEYLIAVNKPEEAKRVVAQMLGVKEDHQVVGREVPKVEDMSNAKQVSTAQPWRHIIGNREICLRTLLAAVLMSFNQLTGANFFYYYGTTIFTSTGISNGYIIQVIVSAINFVSTVPGLYFAQNLRHRRCLSIGAVIMAICFFVFSSVGHFCLDRDDPVKTHAAGAVMVAFTMFFIATFASTWSPLCWAEASLICPARYRATCTSVAIAFLWIWSFLLAYFTPTITAKIDYLYGYVFGGCCLVMAVTVHYCLIESQGHTLEEIDKKYSQWLGGKDG